MTWMRTSIGVRLTACAAVAARRLCRGHGPSPVLGQTDKPLMLCRVACKLLPTATDRCDNGRDGSARPRDRQGLPQGNRHADRRAGLALRLQRPGVPPALPAGQEQARHRRPQDSRWRPWVQKLDRSDPQGRGSDTAPGPADLSDPVFEPTAATGSLGDGDGALALVRREEPGVPLAAGVVAPALLVDQRDDYLAVVLVDPWAGPIRLCHCRTYPLPLARVYMQPCTTSRVCRFVPARGTAHDHDKGDVRRLPRTQSAAPRLTSASTSSISPTAATTGSSALCAPPSSAGTPPRRSSTCSAAGASPHQAEGDRPQVHRATHQPRRPAPLPPGPV